MKRFKLDYEQAAAELRELINGCTSTTLAALYENAFASVITCEESNAGDYFEVTFYDGLEHSGFHNLEEIT